MYATYTVSKKIYLLVKGSLVANFRYTNFLGSLTGKVVLAVVVVAVVVVAVVVVAVVVLVVVVLVVKGSLVANFRYTNFWVAWQEK